MSGNMKAKNAIRLKGLPKAATVTDVLKFLHGLDVDEHAVHLSCKERRGAGEALVVLKAPEDARRALDKDKEIFSPKFGSRFVCVVQAEDLTEDEEAHLAKAHAALERARASASSELRSSETAVRVEGLPAGITVPEVVQLFWGSRATAAGTVVQKDPEKPHTHAIMDMGGPEHAMHAAVTRNGMVVTTSAGMFTLTVQPTSASDWEAAQARGSDKGSTGEDAVVKVRGLPVRAAAADIAAFFEGYAVKAGGVHVQPYADNRHSKVAFVEFTSAEEAERAVAERDRAVLGKAFGERYCLLQRVSKADMLGDVARFTTQTSAPAAMRGSGSAGCAARTGPSAASSLDFTTSCAPSAAFFNMGRATSLPPRPAAMPTPTASFMPPPMMAPPPMAWGPPPMGMPMYPGMPMPMQMSMGPGMMPFPGMVPPMPAASWQAPGMAPMMGDPMQYQQTVAARYMVQDLSTGQKVFLDPRFNLYQGVVPEETEPVRQQDPAPAASESDNEAVGDWAAAGRSAAAAAGNGSKEGSAPDEEDVEVLEEDGNGSNEGSGGDEKPSIRRTVVMKGSGRGSAPKDKTTTGAAQEASGGSGEGATSLRRLSKELPAKRHSLELDLPEDTRPSKHLAGDGGRHVRRNN